MQMVHQQVLKLIIQFQLSNQMNKKIYYLSNLQLFYLYIRGCYPGISENHENTVEGLGELGSCKYCPGSRSIYSSLF